MSKCIPNYNLYLIYCLFCITLILSSCASPKETVYFNDLADSSKVSSIMLSAFKEPVIQPDDIISVTIQTIDPVESAALNQANTTGVIGAGVVATAAPGFLVDKNGNVEIPILGIIKVGGLTTDQARDAVRVEAAKYNKNPTVQVRFANYKITVIGEVNRPATYTVPNEKVSILDMLGLAGDLTIFGKRENVMLIRDNGNKKEIVRLNLTSSSLLRSPYFYLKQNDVIYVEPNKAKISSNNANTRQNITLGVTLITLLITVVTRF